MPLCLDKYMYQKWYCVMPSFLNTWVATLSWLPSLYCAHQLVPALPLGWLPSLPVMASQLVHTSVCSEGSVSVWLLSFLFDFPLVHQHQCRSQPFLQAYNFVTYYWKSTGSPQENTVGPVNECWKIIHRRYTPGITHWNEADRPGSSQHRTEN